MAKLNSKRGTFFALQISCVQMPWAKSLEFNLSRTLQYIRQAAEQGSRVVLCHEASLTSYYFPYVVKLDQKKVRETLARICGDHSR